MKHKVLFLILLFSNSFYSQENNLKMKANENEAKYIKNQLFVKIKDEIDFNPINAIEPREFSNKIKITKAFKLVELQKIYLVEVLDSSITTDSVIRFFTKNEAVEYVERVPLYELFWTPNDPMYLQQWNLQKIQADLAWNISQGKQQIRVAITDDGFLMNHEDLTSMWFINSAENPTNGIDDDNNGYIDDWRGWDAADNDNNPAAFNPSNNYFDHGTHVAGITTVATNNAKGIAGIGGNIQLIPVKIGANSNASLTGAYQGVEYAIIANANVINMSWGGGGFSQTYQNLFNVAKSKNIVCVAAAGNSSTSSWMYPASYQNVISVASTTNTDALSWFSNFGSAIDVCAPGSDILSCHATGITNYTNMSGTSMAAPLVSGLCGLMLSHNLMPADSIEACLKRTSNNINANNPNRIGQIGAGRINAFQALQCVTKNPISSFDILDTFQCSGQLVRYQATSNGAQPLTYQWIFPGGSPSTSTFTNPGVTYSSAGLKSATLITCNTLGCDTITKTNIVRIDTPSAWLTGRKYTTYNSNPAVIAVNFKGNPPYNVTLTDGTNTWVQNNITANPYFFSIVPQLNSSLISIQSFTAKNCVGKVSKQDTIVKNDLNANNINCDTTNLNVGRVLHLDFNGNTQDKSGNNNHATNFGATPVAGKNGAANTAYRFDGINDFMEINSSPITNIISNISIAAIVKVNGFNPQLPQNASSVLTKGNDNSVGFYTLRFTDDVIQNNIDTNTSQFYGQFTNDGIVNIYNSTCDVPPFINKNNWFCAIYTFDGDTAKMYINGQLLWKFKTNTQIGNNNQKIRIGGSFNNFPHEYFLNADIDDIRIYNRVLSASEVKGYCGTCNINPPANDCDTTNLNVGRVLHLDFNGNTQDKSGNNNHATNFGATPVAGKNGAANTAYRFDGINDYMKVNHHSSLNMTNITLTAVLKPNGFYNGTCYGNQIIKKGNTDFVSGEYGLVYSPNGYTNSCFVFDTSHQNYAGYVFNNRPSPNLNNTSPYVIKGQWDCLVYTKNNDSTKFYINGVLKYATASNNHGSNLDDIFIGKMNNWQYPYWLNADIDDIQIYNRVLSATEVKGYCGTCNINPPANDCDTTNLNVGRVLHLDFNGNTQDKSGNNNHATNFGATPVAGKNGATNAAYRFDGINDFMRLNHHSSLNLPNQFTFTCILKPIKFNTAHCFGNVIIGKGDGGSSVGQYNLQYFPFDNGTTCVNRDTTVNNFHFHGVNWCNYTSVTNKPNLKSGTWYCMVATYDGTTLRHFLNGNLVYQCNISLNSINQSNTFDVLIGKWASSSLPHWLNADIDDIRIYNRVLSASEVKGYCGSCNISSPIEKACSKGFKQTIPKCTQETLILNSSNGTKHLWSPKLGLSNDTIQNPICSINQNTTYYSTKIDSVGCQILDTFIIQILTISKFEPISDTLICIGDSATINIKNRTNPIWSPNTHIRVFGTNQFKLFPNQSTDYILNYQDTFGCSFKDTISIKTKICCSLRAQFEMSKTNLCFGDSLMVNNSSSSISGVSFSWSIKPNSVSMTNYNGIQPPTLFFENAGDYTIKLIGDNGSCKDTISKTLVVTKLYPNAGNDTFYCGNALQYQLGESPILGFKYSWNPPTGLNNPNFSNPTLSFTNQKIDYILQMEDTLSGCRFYDTVVVSAFNLKNFSKIIDTLICGRDSIMVSLPSFTKSATWKNAIHISDSLSKQPLLFPKDTQRYIVHFEDSNRCQYQDTFDLFTKICCEHIPHFLVPKNTTCFGETLQITENSTYKTPVKHKWKVIPNTVSPSFSSGKTPPNFQFLDSGKYQIWLTIYDSFCIDSFLREVKVVRIYPNAGLDQSSCRLKNDFSLGFPPVDGYQYVWTPSLYLSNPLISNPTALVFRDSIRYILETRDIASQCVFNYAVDIKTKREIDSSITFDTLCEKQTLDFHGNILNASGFYDTILSDVLNTCDSIYKATHLFIYPRKDSLWAQQYGCKYFRYKNTVFEKDTFLLDSIFNSKGCLVSILQIPIEILNTTIEDSTIIACGSYLHNGLLLTGSYKRIKTNRVPFFRRPTCDSVWRNIGLNILPAPKAIIESDNKNNPIPYGTKLNLEGKGGDFYQWNFENSTEKSIVYEAFQDYRFTIVVSLQNECKDTATYFVKVGEIPDGKIVFPNAFSPNGDQINDYFKPNSYQFGALVSLSIFNRWGEKIFENFNQDAYWDGTYKNEIQPSGVYIYIATFKSPRGDLKTIKGDFLLVR